MKEQLAEYNSLNVVNSLYRICHHRLEVFDTACVIPFCMITGVTCVT